MIDSITMQVAPPEGAICDFCSSPDVHWSYPCRDHQRPVEHIDMLVAVDDKILRQEGTLDAFSGGGWAACNPCHALIERGDRVKLARRSGKRMLKMAPELNIPLANAIAHARRIHDQFWSNRLGAPIYSAQRPTQDPTR